MPNNYRVSLRPDFEHSFPGSSALATESVMNLVFTSEVLLKRISRLLQPLGLTPSSGLVLGILADAAAPLPPNEIARRLIISRASVTSLIDTLERQEYVRRLPHPTDRRMLMVEITDKGRRATSEFRAIVHRHQRSWLQTLGEEEQKQLISFLHRIQSSLDDSGD